MYKILLIILLASSLVGCTNTTPIMVEDSLVQSSIKGDWISLSGDNSLTLGTDEKNSDNQFFDIGEGLPITEPGLYVFQSQNEEKFNLDFELLKQGTVYLYETESDQTENNSYFMLEWKGNNELQFQKTFKSCEQFWKFDSTSVIYKR